MSHFRLKTDMFLSFKEFQLKDLNEMHTGSPEIKVRYVEIYNHVNDNSEIYWTAITKYTT